MNKIITKRVLIETIRAEYPFNAQEITLIVEAFLEQIKQALSNNDRVMLQHFGTFKVGKIRKRTWKRPNSNEILNLPEVKVVNFVCSQKLKRAIR